MIKIGDRVEWLPYGSEWTDKTSSAPYDLPGRVVGIVTRINPVYIDTVKHGLLDTSCQPDTVTTLEESIRGPGTMHSRIYELDDGTIVDEIINDDGVVLAKSVTPPPRATPQTAEDWAKVMADAGVTGPLPDHVWDFRDGADMVYEPVRFEAGEYHFYVTGWRRKASDPDPVQAADVDHFEQHHDRRLIAVMKNGERLDLGFDPDMPMDWGKPIAPPTDPLDVVYDGLTLSCLLTLDENSRRESVPYRRAAFTPSQRAAISAHWSAELRQRVEATKEKQRTQVVVEGEDE
jgi:hypothetical protein